MAYACDYCGKTRQKAHKVSHSNIKTRKWQEPNLQPVRAFDHDGQLRHARRRRGSRPPQRDARPEHGEHPRDRRGL